MKIDRLPREVLMELRTLGYNDQEISNMPAIEAFAALAAPFGLHEDDAHTLWHLADKLRQVGR